MRPFLVPTLAALLFPVAAFAEEAAEAPTTDETPVEDSAPVEPVEVVSEADASTDPEADAAVAEETTVDLPKMAPVTPVPPEPVLVPPLPSQEQLVNTVVPHYGTYSYQPYHKDSRVEEVYHEIRNYVGTLETQILSGEVHRPAQQYERIIDESGIPQATPIPREPMPEELHLVELLEKLSVLKAQIPYPNHYEAWHFDNSWRDLEHAASMLRLGMADEIWLRLEELHASWLNYYIKLLAKAQAERAQQLVDEEEMPPSEAILQAEQEITEIEYPHMRHDGSYPAVEIPEIARKEPTPQEAEAPEAGVEGSVEGADGVEVVDVDGAEATATEPDVTAKADATASVEAAEEEIEEVDAPAEPEMAPEPVIDADFESLPELDDEPAAIEVPELEEEPVEVAAPEMPAAPDLSLAEALHDRGAQLHAQATDDDSYNTAELVLTAAVDEYSALLESDPENINLAGKLREANRLRRESSNAAETYADENPAAVENANSTIQAVIQAHASGDLSSLSEPEPMPEPVLEEPEPIPEPEPVFEEPELEPEAAIEEPEPALVEEEVVEEVETAVEEVEAEAEVEIEAEVEEIEPEAEVETTEAVEAETEELEIEVEAEAEEAAEDTEASVEEAADALDDLDLGDF